MCVYVLTATRGKNEDVVGVYANERLAHNSLLDEVGEWSRLHEDKVGKLDHHSHDRGLEALEMVTHNGSDLAEFFQVAIYARSVEL